MPEGLSGTAVIAIDLHRGHLDPEVATLPLPADRSRKVIANCERFFAACRGAGVPIFHLVTRYRDAGEILSNPAWEDRDKDPSSTRRNMAVHNLVGSPGTEIIPSLRGPDDIVVDTKKRYDCFIGTDLDFALRTRGVESLWVTGVNTNSCVLATSIEASCRDFRVTVVSDCVDTMDGADFHDAALRILERAFTEVRPAAELVDMT